MEIQEEKQFETGLTLDELIAKLIQLKELYTGNGLVFVGNTSEYAQDVTRQPHIGEVCIECGEITAKDCKGKNFDCYDLGCEQDCYGCCDEMYTEDEVDDIKAEHQQKLSDIEDLVNELKENLDIMLAKVEDIKSEF
ncbi:MAG: hypothetical protein WC998_00775 [Candidatus Paceibacterota bacterium]|jgi:hypothetical protein